MKICFTDIDGETRSESVSNIKKSGYKKINKSVTIQDFFSKEV